MTILFLSYWSINEGLTQSTVIPHVDFLVSMSAVEKVILCTIERGEFNSVALSGKVEHIPLISKNYGNLLINKISDFTSLSSAITRIVRKQKVGLMICRSSLAGGIGHIVSKRTKVPFVVESFEPHASYMLESGVWKKYDPRYWIEILFQKIQRRSAMFLMPVAENYSQELISRGVDSEKIITVPCIVDPGKFYRRQNTEMRARLKIDASAIVGIYVGKFGGMYLDQEAFSIFVKASQVFDNFYLLILTPENLKDVETKLLNAGLEGSSFRIMCVQHSEVPEYLSVADFAFATYKPSESKKFLSPIKVGEYWACGLPVLLTKGVGDDSAIIEATGAGAVFSLEGSDIEKALRNIQIQLKSGIAKETNIQLAHIHRNPEKLQKAYRKVIQRALSEAGTTF